MWLSVVLLFIASFLTGCQFMESKQPVKIIKISSTSSDDKVVNVSISNSKGFYHVNQDFFIEYEDASSLSFFEDVYSSAEAIPGIVDMAEPEYDLEVTYSDGSTQGFHLWVGDEGEKSALMSMDDTNTVYSIPVDLSKSLNEFVQSK
jgi:hypothetical protein